MPSRAHDNPSTGPIVREYDLYTERGHYIVQFRAATKVSPELASIPFHIRLGSRLFDEGRLEIPLKTPLVQAAHECVAWAEAREDILKILLNDSSS